MIYEVKYIDFEKVRETNENESFYSENSLPSSMRLRDYGFPFVFLTIKKNQELDISNILEKFITDAFAFEYKNEVYLHILINKENGGFMITKISDLYKYYQLIGMNSDLVEKYMKIENRYKNLEEFTK